MDPKDNPRAAHRRINWDLEIKIFKSRESLARCIRKQELEPGSSHHWTAFVHLAPHEGYGPDYGP